jgi:hypothetical protein
MPECQALRLAEACVCRESDAVAMGKYRESGAELGGPGLTWSCVERENNNLLVDEREKYRSIESLFHLPIFIMSAREMPAFSAELAAPRRKE